MEKISYFCFDLYRECGDTSVLSYLSVHQENGYIAGQA